MEFSEFEFPASVPSISNDVVFCGKVIARRTEPGSAPHNKENRVLLISEYSGRSNGFVKSLRSPSGKENRCRRNKSCRKLYNGMFGTVKFPLHMELSDIKVRRDRRDPPPPLPPPRFEAEDDGDGGESCWELVRPLRRAGTLKNAFFGCFFPVV